MGGKGLGVLWRSRDSGSKLKINDAENTTERKGLRPCQVIIDVLTPTLQVISSSMQPIR